MSRPDDAVEPVVRRAQTVAPVQESTLLAAAALLGDAGYTPDRELNGTLNSPARAHETVVEPVATPSAPERRVQPVEREVVTLSAATPVRKGFFARLLDKLLGRS